MARKTRKAEVPTAEKPGRYTTDRFFGHTSHTSRTYLEQQWREGNLLVVNTLKRDMLAVVVLMATYGIGHGYQLVDDYELLLSRTQDELQHFGSINHYDLFCVSSIIINYENYRPTPVESLDLIGMRLIWTELMGDEP